MCSAWKHLKKTSIVSTNPPTLYRRSATDKYDDLIWVKDGPTITSSGEPPPSELLSLMERFKSPGT